MNDRIVALMAAFLPVFLLGGCSGGGRDSSPLPIDARGTYATTGTWSIGGPLAGARTPGDVAAELVVETLVDAAGVPSFAEDEARALLAGAIAADIAAAVDARLPGELQEGSPLRLGLASVLGNVGYQGTLVIEDGPAGGTLRGNETLSRIFVVHDGNTFQLLPAVIAEAGAFGSAWDGDPRGAQIRVEDHEVGIRFGALVRWAAADVLGESSVDSLSAQAANAVVCSEIVDSILDGSATLRLNIGPMSYELAAPQITDACSVAREEIGSRVLGMFDYGLLELGGDLAIVDGDGDGRADLVRSEEGYGGLLFLPPLPDPFAPRVSATLAGTRP